MGSKTDAEGCWKGFPSVFEQLEHWWNKIKTAIKKELPKHNFDVHKATSVAFQYL